VDQRQGALEDVAVNPAFWSGKRVLVTGHTGFKGAWLSLWLARMGAQVSGLALAPVGQPNLYELARVGDEIRSTIADINDRQALRTLLSEQQPEIVLHLAAQALVRASYDDPVATFAANVGGVVTLMDELRRVPSIRSIVIVTSDKCYDNKEWVWGYRESDTLGGRDPYSASKGCAEIAARSMQMSYFAPYAANGHPARVATVRAGNVIGGGDWSEDRLVPDIIRGCLGPSGEVQIRNPRAIRPWQHVLEPLAAYLAIAEKLTTDTPGIDDAWNIGPDAGDNRAVADVAQGLIAALGAGRIVTEGGQTGPHEANLLALDCSKAKAKLGWRPRFGFEECIAYTADWYSAWAAGRDMAAFTRAQIETFEQLAKVASPPAGRRSA
jgi:CDP-glucose 4,6-dehydratase